MIWSLWNLYTWRPEAVAQESSKGATKSLKFNYIDPTSYPCNCFSLPLSCPASLVYDATAGKNLPSLWLAAEVNTQTRCSSCFVLLFISTTAKLFIKLEFNCYNFFSNSNCDWIWQNPASTHRATLKYWCIIASWWIMLNKWTLQQLLVYSLAIIVWVNNFQTPKIQAVLSSFFCDGNDIAGGNNRCGGWA